MTPKMAMEVSPVNSAEIVQKKLLSLIAACDSFSWASAWITDTRVFRSALRARAKMHRFVVGTHPLHHLRQLFGTMHRLATRQSSGPDWPTLFHPKVYAFRLHDRDVVYVGSSNLTEGLRRNVECGVFLSGSRCDPTLAQYFDFINEKWDEAGEIDIDFLCPIEPTCDVSRKHRPPLSSLCKSRNPTYNPAPANKVDPATMTWAILRQRCALTRLTALTLDWRSSVARGRFLTVVSRLRAFQNLIRKSLAGLLKPSIRDGLDWGYFGQMSAFGSYTPLLEVCSRVLECSGTDPVVRIRDPQAI